MTEKTRGDVGVRDGEAHESLDRREAYRSVRNSSISSWDSKVPGRARSSTDLMGCTPLPSWWPRNGAPGLRARHDCLPPVAPMTWGVMSPGLEHRLTADKGLDRSRTRRNAGRRNRSA